jgi:hypothetical protein
MTSCACNSADRTSVGSTFGSHQSFGNGWPRKSAALLPWR